MAWWSVISRVLVALVAVSGLAFTAVVDRTPVAHAVVQSSRRVALVPNASGELCCAGTMPTSGTVAGTTLSFNNFQFSNLAVSAVNAANLAGFDTLVLLQVNISELTAQQRSDINAFIDNGGKFILYDSDGTQGSDYSWLIRPFSTFSPCPNCGLRGGTLTIIENDTLGTNDTASPLYINTAELPPNTDAVGDANVFATSDPNWFGHMRATNARNQTGLVHAYAESPSGKGLLIYNGLDSDFIGSSAAYPSRIDWLGKIWYQELAQQWDPSNLPGTNPVSSQIRLTPLNLTLAVSGTASMTAAVTDRTTGAPIQGAQVTFTVTGANPRSAMATSDSLGFATFAYTGTTVGLDNVIATATIAARLVQSNTSHIRWTPRPVVFIHGIGGAELAAKQASPAGGVRVPTSDGGSRMMTYNAGEVEWLNIPRAILDPEFLDIIRFTDDASGPLFPDIDTNGNLLTAPSSYGDIDSFFTGAGYTKNINFFDFVYDWRRPAESNATRLEAFVRAARDATFSGNVDIVTHSMGGLVVRPFLTAPGNQSLVAHVVMLAPPQMGTPLGSHSVIAGQCLTVQGPLCIVPPQTLQFIYRTLPSGLDLSVSQAYYSFFDGSDADHPTAFLDVRSGTPRQSYADLRSALVQARAALPAISGAEGYHANDLSWMSQVPGKISIFAGSGICTLGQIREYTRYQQFPPLIGPVVKVDAFDYRAVDGDGTVVRQSVTLFDRAKGIFANGGAPLYFRPLAHTDLASNQALPDVLSVLREQSVSFGDIVRPDCTGFSVQSPVEFVITDSAGNRLGTSVGAATPSRDIPGAQYQRFNDMKFALLSRPGTYQVSMNGTATGDATVRLRTINGGVVQQAIFAHVPTTATSKATATITTTSTTGTISDLVNDVRGDATDIQTFRPVLLSGAAADDVTPPTLTVTSPLTGQSIPSPVNVAWTASDAVSGMSRTFAVVDIGTQAAMQVNAPGTVTLPSGPHTVDFFAEDQAGNLATQQVTFQVTNVPHSLRVDGATGYAEAPHTADLNITGDWTVEMWFKDEDPNGFNHDFRQLLMKGDRDADPEAPYYMLVGNNSILVGLRTAWVDYPLTFDLKTGGLDPTQWHHVAVTFNSSINVINLWLDGVHIDYLTVPTRSTGNTLPLEIGRNGPVTSKYWLGKLDDVRIWNVVRSGADITANYRSELTSVPPGLVANWKFNESSGTSAADSAGTHTATLNGGASFSTDVHP